MIAGNASYGEAHPAQLLAETLTRLKRLGVDDRAIFDRILRTMLEQQPRCLGFWSVWEPNALDGRDREFVNRAGHDATGRYVPFWNRGRGSIAVEPNVFYETPGVGEFYLRPRREGRETVIEPYEYPVAGRARFITTRVAPIFLQGDCVGAAGFDIAVEEIPNAARADDNPLEHLLSCGYVFLDDPTGRGAVAYCSGHSRRLLGQFFGAAAPRRLPLRMQRALLDAETTRAAAPETLTFRAGHTELLVRRFEHRSTGPGLLLSQRSPRASAPLSVRERQVLDWLSRGKTNPEIGAILGISCHTVKRHVEKVLDKLRVPNRNAAALSHWANLPREVGPWTYTGRGQGRLACAP